MKNVIGEDGQLGHGDKKNFGVPTMVNTLNQVRVTEVALGLWHSLLRTIDGQNVFVRKFNIWPPWSRGYKNRFTSQTQ